MLSALRFYPQLKQKDNLKACPVFIGPNDDIVDTCIRALEAARGQQIERLTAKDNDAFFTQLIICQSQRNFFAPPQIYYVESCSPKFIERCAAYTETLKPNLVFRAPKLPYKSPLISRLEQTGKFLFLTCFDPSPQDLLSFAENYLGTKDQRLKDLLPQLPHSLVNLVPELDKIALSGFDAYVLEESLQEKTIDHLCYDFLRGNPTAPSQLSQSLVNEQIEPTAFLKMMLYQLRKLRDYLSADSAAKAALRLSKVNLARYEKLANQWKPEDLEKKIAAFFDLENKMRHQHEIASLVLEQGLFTLFISSQTKL